MRSKILIDGLVNTIHQKIRSIWHYFISLRRKQLLGIKNPCVFPTQGFR